MLEKAWYSKARWVWVLWPLSALFWTISTLRRYLFKAGFLNQIKPARTIVIVVGNISVGGNGKTPVVLALAEYLKKKGWSPGVLSRGYGGTQTEFPHLVASSDGPALVGDEPKLIAARTGLPVIIDPKRPRGAQRLAQQESCDVVICDDGLQHYALDRDIELVVMDERRYGNGHLLPMGPLREGTWRLDTVDMLIHNVDNFKRAELLGVSTAQFHMQLTPGEIVNVKHPEQRLSIAAFVQRYTACEALAGIGNPERFFTQLKQLGINCRTTHSKADHHAYCAADIPPGPVIMTEKDAVKVAQIGHDECWYLEVCASLPDTLYKQLDKKLAHLAG
ncbi:tetraacyldisaccharide 4'-kinase [Salinimonas chungwhensis]|uniref:tetraacyldisaccharide 4'-kinase n=1 Tax=Salinimonas chungwhensis TaxID=265425 RepID=UPI00058F8343|nr:tetraacyldisaccharide 4'-kinase [Salinimonas chungwhensis]